MKNEPVLCRLAAIQQATHRPKYKGDRIASPGRDRRGVEEDLLQVNGQEASIKGTKLGDGRNHLILSPMGLTWGRHMFS